MHYHDQSMKSPHVVDGSRFWANPLQSGSISMNAGSTAGEYNEANLHPKTNQCAIKAAIIFRLYRSVQLITWSVLSWLAMSQTRRCTFFSFLRYSYPYSNTLMKGNISQSGEVTLSILNSESWAQRQAIIWAWVLMKESVSRSWRNTLISLIYFLNAITINQHTLTGWTCFTSVKRK